MFFDEWLKQTDHIHRAYGIAFERCFNEGRYREGITAVARGAWDAAKADSWITFEKIQKEIKQLEKENEYLRSLIHARHN